MPSPRSPHDEFFKAVFSDLNHARDLLQGILPAEVAALLDLSSLELEPGSFVSESLRKSFTDLLFSCPLHGTRAVVAILLEHKTWEPTHPHLQILRYMVGIWEKNLIDQVPLQVIIPVLLHQGTVPWKATPFSAFFPDIPESLSVFIPDVRVILQDLVQTGDARLQTDFHHPFVQTALAIMKHIFSPEGTLAVARSLNPDLAGLPKEDALHSLHILLEYILRSGDIVLRNALIEALDPNLKGETMTIADALRLEGREEAVNEVRTIADALRLEGRAEAENEVRSIADALRMEGREEGKEEGIRASKIEDARKMLEHGIAWTVITDITGIKPEEVA